MPIIDAKVKQDIRPYIYQSVIATLTILVILLFLDVMSHTAIIASLGSSAFVVFTRPRAYASRPRPLLGGYFIGILVGVLCHYLSILPTLTPLPVSTSVLYVVFSAMAVGAAIFLMVVTNTEHGPAAGIALGLVINSWDIRDLVFVFGAVMLMALMRQLLKPFMIDLI